MYQVMREVEEVRDDIWIRFDLHLNWAAAGWWISPLESPPLSCLQSLVSCLWNYENLNSSRTETESRPSNYTDWDWRWRLLEIFRSSVYCEMYALLDKVTLNLNHFADKNNCSKQNDFVRNIIVMIRLLTYLDLAQSPASLTPNSALCSTLQTFWQNFYYFLSEASEDSLLLLPGLLSK